MIDWRGIATNALWITGLAVLLATFSYRRYQAGQEKTNDEDEYQHIFYDVGLLLFCAGLLFAANSWLERGAWGGILLLIVGTRLLSVYNARRDHLQ